MKTGTEIEQMMAKIMDTENMGYAYFYPSDGSSRKEYLIATTPENMANFIGSHFFDADKMIITDMMDRLIVNTIGGFLDRCPDQGLCMKLQNYLIPIQQGEKEAGEILMVTRNEAEDFFMEEDCRITAAECVML